MEIRGSQGDRYPVGKEVLPAGVDTSADGSVARL